LRVGMTTVSKAPFSTRVPAKARFSITFPLDSSTALG
jgi:hypothetical protein